MSEAAIVQFAPAPFNVQTLLNGEMADRYGALPMVKLPQEDELLIGFVHSMGAVLNSKDIYRRDRIIVIPNEEMSRLDVMSAEMFCSWSQSYVATSKVKHDKNGDSYYVCKDMPTEAALKVLVSPHFAPYVRKIDEVHSIPLPCFVDGVLEVMAPGFFDGGYTFALD